MSEKVRKVRSIKNELVHKSRESMLTAVQIFNNPNMQFKSESFIVLVIIAWTYLLHAYYLSQKVEYRFFKQNGKRKKFDKTRYGAYKFWELERCLNCPHSPIDHNSANNLKFLIGLRHEIEHQMTTKIDDLLGGKFHACCLNYNHYLKKLFPKHDAIEEHLSFSLQFSSLNEGQIKQLIDFETLPQNISNYIQGFEDAMSDYDFNDMRFSYRVFFIPKTANHKGQADRVIEFISPESEIAKGMNESYVVVKEKEKPKYLPGEVCKIMQKKGFLSFNIHKHTLLWKAKGAKNPDKRYGIQIAKTWYWYESWLKLVIAYCEEHKEQYT